MKHRVYISASTQKENKGVGSYGTEEGRMTMLADRARHWLLTQNKFEVYRNSPNWTLQQTVKDCNDKGCSLFIDNHTNAGPVTAQGTEVYYCEGSNNGKKLAYLLYDAVAPLSPGKDRGVKPDTALHKGGLFVLRHTMPPAVLIEHIFHTNNVEVKHFLEHIDQYAKAEAQAICKYFNVAWVEPKGLKK